MVSAGSVSTEQAQHRRRQSEQWPQITSVDSRQPGHANPCMLHSWVIGHQWFFSVSGILLPRLHVLALTKGSATCTLVAHLVCSSSVVSTERAPFMQL